MKNGHAIIAFVLCACLGGCGRADEPEKQQPSGEVRELYQAVQDRLVGMLDGGYVVSRWDDGRPEHLGDALIWSGIALHALDCAHGQPIEDSLVAMVGELEGGLWRHPMLPDQVSMDGSTGFYRGVASRIDRCPGARERWAAAFAQHQAFSRPADRLNPDADVVLPKEFPYVRDLLAHRLGLAGQPSADRLRILEAEVIAWARAPKLAHDTGKGSDACFRINVGYQTLRTIQALGGPLSAPAKDLFCATAHYANFATVEHWCERADIGEWIAGFEYDRYEYAHQRCPWESADGKAGLVTPALDLAEALKEKYAL